MSQNDSPSMGKIVAVAFIAVMAVAIVLSLIGLAAGWFDKAKEVVGPQNVEKQQTEIIAAFNSVQMGANNACLAGKVSKEMGDPVLVEKPEIAYGGIVRSQVADYNRRQDNIFEARLVAPSGYPRTLPTPGPNEDWCTYAQKVADLKR